MLLLFWVQCTWIAWSEITCIIAWGLLVLGIRVFISTITPNHIHNIASTRIQPLWCGYITSHFTCFLLFGTRLLLSTSKITFAVIDYLLSSTRTSLCRRLIIWTMIILVIIGWSFSTLICLKWHITHIVRLLALVLLITIEALLVIILSSTRVVISVWRLLIITLTTSLVIRINLSRLRTVICVLWSRIICIILVATIFLLIVILTLIPTTLVIIPIITLVWLPTLVVILTVVFMLHKSNRNG